jgi:hypothetical protein
VSSAIPGALSALVAALQPIGVQVFDGPPLLSEPRDYICVGFDPNGDEAVDFDRDWSQLGARRQEERFDVLCSLATWSGDEDMTARRARAFDLFDAVCAAVAADFTLANTVRIASVLGTGSLVQVQDEFGASAGLRFRVTCQARIDN